MPSINGWAGNAFPLGSWTDDIDPGVDAARLIAAKTTSITVIRDGAALSAQLVRIEELGSRAREVQSPAGVTAIANVFILGYKGHPTITDTDLQTGDRFALAGAMYEILMVVPGLSDSLQAYAMVRS